MMQAVPVLKGPMTALKVPPTLQSLSGKEEEQHQAPQNLNLVSHAVRTTRGEPALTRDCHQYQEVDFQRQLLQEPCMSQNIHRIPKALQQDGAEGRHRKEGTSDEQNILQMIREPPTLTSRRSPPETTTEVQSERQNRHPITRDWSEEETNQNWSTTRPYLLGSRCRIDQPTPSMQD